MSRARLFLGLRRMQTGRRERKPWKEFSGEKALASRAGAGRPRAAPAGFGGEQKCARLHPPATEATGWKVKDQPFADETPRGTVQFVNLIARRRNREKRSSISFARITTRRPSTRFDSSARMTAARAPARSLKWRGCSICIRDLAAQIELVFFDGEEAYESSRKAMVFTAAAILRTRRARQSARKLSETASSGT